MLIGGIRYRKINRINLLRKDISLTKVATINPDKEEDGKTRQTQDRIKGKTNRSIHNMDKIILEDPQGNIIKSQVNSKDKVKISNFHKAISNFKINLNNFQLGGNNNNIRTTSNHERIIDSSMI
jgi:hypothetical protein